MTQESNLEPETGGDVKLEWESQVHESDDPRGMASRLVAPLSPDQAKEYLERIKDRQEANSAQVALAIECWEKAATSRKSDWEFAQEVASWILEIDCSEGVALRIANRLAWATSGEPFVPTEEDWEARFTHGKLEPIPSNLFLVALYCNRPRFLFQFKAVDNVLDELPKAVRDDWPICMAFRAFDLLGIRKNTNISKAKSLIQKAVDECSDGVRQDVYDICLHALDASPDASEVAQDSVDLAESMGSAQYSSVVQFRLAKAHGRLAWNKRGKVAKSRQHSEAALEAVNLALKNLKGDNDFTRFLGEQLRSCREYLTLQNDLIQQEERILSSERHVNESEKRILGELSVNTIRSTEVLALFSSAVAFAVGAVAIGASAKAAWSAIAIGFFLLVGLLGFSSLLMLATRIAVSRTQEDTNDADGASNGDKPPERGLIRFGTITLATIAILLSIASIFVSLALKH